MYVPGLPKFSDCTILSSVTGSRPSTVNRFLPIEEMLNLHIVTAMKWQVPKLTVTWLSYTRFPALGGCMPVSRA